MVVDEVENVFEERRTSVLEAVDVQLVLKEHTFWHFCSLVD